MRGARAYEKALIAAFVLASLTLVANNGSAQLDSARSAAAARSIFREGVACAERAEWPCAIEHFERAYGLRPSAVISYNLGMALLQVGRLVEGTEMLGRVARDEGASPELRSDADRASESARPRIGQITIRVQGPLEGVSLTLDGHALPTELLGAASPADPGPHLLIALRDGLEVARSETQLEDGERGELSLEVPPLPLAHVPPPPLSFEPSPTPTDDTPWIILGIGGGVLLVGGAIALGVVLGQPQPLTPFEGSLGHVEIGR